MDLFNLLCIITPNKKWITITNLYKNIKDRETYKKYLVSSVAKRKKSVRCICDDITIHICLVKYVSFCYIAK